jgi:selenide,water dikinase
VDFFPPIVDDPYMFGQIAAANALSDVYAMGGQPKLAMNLLTFPNGKLPLDAVKGILEGGNDKVCEAGATIVGGHSIDDKEPKYGLSVTGFAHPDDILSNSASAGDLLVITKKIGTGVLTTAAKVDLLTEEENAEIEATMAFLNKYAWEAMQGVKVDGCTDITGFGLMGHAAEMARAGGVTLELYSHKVPIFPRALEMAAMGIIPAGAYRNMDYVGAEVMEFLSKDPNRDPDLRARIDCLYDPQSSGGLLIAAKESEIPRLIEQLGERGCETDVIGCFKPGNGRYSVEIHD